MEMDYQPNLPRIPESGEIHPNVTYAVPGSAILGEQSKQFLAGQASIAGDELLRRARADPAVQNEVALYEQSAREQGVEEGKASAAAANLNTVWEHGVQTSEISHLTAGISKRKEKLRKAGAASTVKDALIKAHEKKLASMEKELERCGVCREETHQLKEALKEMHFLNARNYEIVNSLRIEVESLEERLHSVFKYAVLHSGNVPRKQLDEYERMVKEQERFFDQANRDYFSELNENQRLEEKILERIGRWGGKLGDILKQTGQAIRERTGY